ncbi:MAG: PHP domain-containing protein [Candidatus Dormibacteraeota bacterium]|nr:PHP domain-containing protein [Candidatus Dormibacteraeota bacterium]MBO0762715.1 PHP domain-containing protein [Candidatus Dormibacteraeota bacterium]
MTAPAWSVAAPRLAEIGYWLRVREEQYRARAFTSAALVLAHDRPDLVALHEHGQLATLPSIGSGIARVIADLLEQGRSAYLDRLREEAGWEAPTPDGRLGLDGYQGDLHSHTTWSDGKFPLEAMVEGARDRGYAYVAITDHSPRITVTNGLDGTRLAAQRAEIDELARRTDGLTILQGVEVDILEDGTLDLPDETLAALDLVIASPHVRLRMDRSAMTERMLRALENPHVDVIGHPTGRRPGARAGADYDVEAVFRRAAELGVALELDTDPARIDLGPELARLAAGLGCTFCLDSDAHAPGEFAYVEIGLWCPELVGLGPDRFLNWLSLDALRGALR